MESLEKKAIDRVLTARHPDRPYTIDIIEGIFENFVELHGDRRFAEDSAMVCGFANLGELKTAVIGQQKGRDTNQRRIRNFGMPKPEGYRKALRVMKLAEKFGRPIITFIDTPGAYPGIDAEERGQAEAIAYNLREMAGLKVPTVAVVVGEGGSGGALAIAVSDAVIMMENSVYSVISPEGCAAILWKNADKSADAAECLKLTSFDLKNNNLIDTVISEKTSKPGIWSVASDNLIKKEEQNGKKITVGNLEGTNSHLKDVLIKTISELNGRNQEELLNDRYQKYRNMGVWK